MFQLIDCAGKCSPERLNEYLSAKELQTIPTNDRDLVIGSAFLEIINGIESQETRGEIEGDFQFISEMTGGAETRLLSERAKRQTDTTIPKDFWGYGNYDKALWLFMHAQDLFMAAYTDCEIEDMSSWIAYRVPLIDTKTVLAKANDIAAFVSEYYQLSGRGKFCRAVPIEKEHFVGVAAHPLNYAQNLDSYDDQGKPEMKKIASAFGVFFLYIPIKGENAAYLNIKIKDGGRNNKEIEFFAYQFAEKVLGKPLNDSARVRYSLSKLEKMDETFDAFDDEDGLDHIKVTEIVLDHPSMPAKLILRTKRGATGKNMTDIATQLKALHIQSLKGYRIVHAIFRFQFKKGKEGKRDWKSKGVVTASVNTNRQSSCNLGISEPHLIARKYLRKLGIELSTV